MASNQDNGRSATDIITYIGVPLAVLGVLPILYNTFATLASLARIRRMLRHSKLTALTRSDVVNRVIEIELPQYAVMPLHRSLDRHEYWTSQTPSPLPGGTWTTFNWRTNVIGVKTQRVEYADQVKQPQATVALDELVCYLMDLGAVPDSQGWQLLRSAGLWAPVGCCLMRSPDGREKALTVGPLHDSDGHLSLTVAWSSSWVSRGATHLPPYWIRLASNPRTAGRHQKTTSTDGTGADLKDRDEKPKEPLLPVTEDHEQSTSHSKRVSLGDSIDAEGHFNEQRDLNCEIEGTGLVAAHPAADNSERTDSPPQPLYIEHLRLPSSRSTAIPGNAKDGVWWASSATAYGTSSRTVLWNYKIPDEILAFAAKTSVPCGIMVILGMVDEAEAPDWATKYEDAAKTSMEIFVQRSDERRMAMSAESRMTPDQRQHAVRERMMRESQQTMRDMREKRRLEETRQDQRFLEALQSPRWDNPRVAKYAFHWLCTNTETSESYDSSFTAKDAAGHVLHRMVLDGQFATSICAVMNTWKGWADRGGMQKADLEMLKGARARFAEAILLVSLISDSSSELAGTLALDLQDCLRTWKTVRLG